MSWLNAPDPSAAAPACNDLAAVILPRARDLGSFEVRRALPAAARQMVGPFIFFDQMGPAVFHKGEGLDVRPHPHIGLATVTYLFEGEILHRDSLGSVQPIQPGALNWMSAGRGVAHSERTDARLRAGERRMYGIQAWVALPAAREEEAPSFIHHPAGELPLFADGGLSGRVIVGSFAGVRSSVTAAEDGTVYAEVNLQAGARLGLPPFAEERGLYLVEGTVEIAGDRHEGPAMLVFAGVDTIAVEALTAVRAMVLGGPTADGPRHIWWNFVSSRKERIEQAKNDWQNRREEWFGPVAEEPSEYIPLPG